MRNSSQNPTVIVYAKRTAIGKLMGGLSTISAPNLSAKLVADSLATTGINGSDVNEIIMGQVLSAGVGQAPARQAAIYGGLPHSVLATTINRVCGSGLKAVMLADDAIQRGHAQIVFAGGQENMSLAPHLLPGSRSGFKFGAVEMKDHMQFDGLWDPYSNVAMGNCGEDCAKKYNFSRAAQDEFSLMSYERARKATENGHFSKEIVAIDVAVKKTTVKFDRDEQCFSVELSKIPELRPAFDKAGTITAGNASPLNDGAALVVVTDLATAQKNGLKPIAKIFGQASYAHEPTWFTTAPIPCVEKLLKKVSWQVSDVDQFEINEAFAVVPMAAIKDLNLDVKKVNPYGGAVALGHPIGASGARVLVTLLNGLQTTGGKKGIATLCIGGGEASAIAIEMMS